MTYQTTTHHNFPETDREALVNIAKTQGNILAIIEDALEGLDKEEPMSILLEVSKSLNASVDVYLGAD